MTSIGERRAVYAGLHTRELWVGGRGRLVASQAPLTGPTVVLLHGFALSAATWRPLMEQLAESGTSAVAVDLPGFGSADPPDEQLNLVSQLDEFVADVVRHHGRTGAVVLVGNSLGAAAAVRAARNPTLPISAVMTLAVAGIAWTKFTTFGLPSIIAAAAAGGRFGLHAAVVGGLAPTVLARLMYAKPSDVDAEIVADAARVLPNIVEAHRIVTLGSRYKLELAETGGHGGVRAPMTVVHGRQDRLVPVSASRILHEANAGSQLIVLPDAGHCPQLDSTDAIAQLVRKLTASAAA